MLIIKIGGGKTINIEGIIADLAGIDEQFIIVHGANALRDELAQTLGKPKKVVESISGYSSVFSDETAIDLMMMAYAGLRNKRVVEACQKNGINAVGLSGLDGRIIQGRRNKGIKVYQNGKKMILRDFSGKPIDINTDLLNLLLENGYTPILSVPIIDENDFAINSENDDIINVLQKSVNAHTIIQFIETLGFLDDINDPQSIVKSMNKEELVEREILVEGRMKRKILALKKLFEGGAARVIIADGRTERPVSDALAGMGTIIQ